MKAILFAGIICCLIAAVDAEGLFSEGLKQHKNKHTAQAAVSASAMMADMDARFLASE